MTKKFTIVRICCYSKTQLVKKWVFVLFLRSFYLPSALKKGRFKMNQFKKITNQELLKELESRLTGFTQNEFATLMVLLQNHQQQVMEIIQADNPQVYQ
jgi:hypothetical protein